MTVIRPVALYATECWPATEKHEQILNAMETKMLRWMERLTRLDRVTNEDVRKRVGVATIEKKMRETHLHFGTSCAARRIRCQEQPSDREEDRRTGGWTQSPKICTQWISPQRTLKTDPNGDRVTQRTPCWEDARKEEEEEEI